jgi:aspartyl protease
MFKALVAGGAVMLGFVIGAGKAGAAVPPDEKSPIRIRVIHDRFVLVPVMVNGTGPYFFLLDTGATSTMLSPTLVKRLGLSTSGAAVQETATHAGRVPLVRASLAVGGVARPDVEVIAAPLDAVQALDHRIVGVLGQDVLRSSNWWLDYEGSVLVADTDGRYLPRGLGERVAVHWHAERPAVDVLLPDHQALRLVLDSAAASPLLFREVAGPSVPAEGWARLTTHFGETSARQVVVGPLRVGALVVPSLAAAMVGDRAADRAEDGLLPTGLFEGIYFDNRADAVVFNPRRSAMSYAP